MAILDPDRLDEHFGWRRPVPMPPLARFDTPEHHERPPRTALGEHIYRIHRANRMAGTWLRPTFIEFTNWLRAEHRTPDQRWFIREFIHQIHPLEWKMLALNSGLTGHEIARAMIDSGIDRASPPGWAFPRLPGEVCPPRVALRDPALLDPPGLPSGREDAVDELATRIV